MSEYFSVITVDFLLRFIVLLITLTLFLRFIYYRHTPDRDTLFGYSVFGYGVYLVAALLHDVDMSMGFAFGLFAIFSMLRYRTEAISIRDMTYLFTVIVIGLMAAVGPITMFELIGLNVLICLLTFVAETTLFAPKFADKKIVYEKIDLIRPECEQQLLDDLRSRTGLDIVKVAVGRIDFLRDTADLRIYYLESQQSAQIDY